ncbi:hypothetical protein [Humibacillus xanthopallidus]|uniref:hypothetical protein n=1 Tax=Humibacillus xanthopallidus TaxID=412689 RepID=UPI00384EB289
MTSPRNLVMAGAVLIAVALAASGHGFWWLIGLVWALPHLNREGRGGCAGRSLRHAPGPDPQPDPTSDRHVAFPAPR